MPYKDKEKAKEATKERVGRYREKQKALQAESLTGEERIKYIQGRLGKNLVEKIEKAVKFDILYKRPLSRDERYENACRYLLWAESRCRGV